MILTLLIGVLLLVTGSFLLKHGWWPRRVGDTPHCPKCDYILSGDQTRCPECGTVADLKTVVRGERRRRPILAGIGVVLLGFAALGLLNFAFELIANVDWQRHYPLGWLLRGVTNNSSPAWKEIQRRVDANLLSESDLNAVVERGILVQDWKTQNIAVTNVLDFIAGRYLAHKLTPDQADRFLGNMLKVNLSGRLVVGSQSRVPFSLKYVGHGPTRDWWYRVETSETQIDDRPVDRRLIHTTTGAGGFGGLSIDGTVDPVETPGRHRLRMRVVVTVGSSGGVFGGNWDKKAIVAKQVSQDLYANFEVIEGLTPISTVAMPDAGTMRSLLRPMLNYHSNANPPLIFSVFGNGLPVDAAFDVFVRLDGKEYPLGGVYLHDGFAASLWGVDGTNNFPTDIPLNADVILRSSEEVARQSVGITRLWKGEIVFKSLSIERPK